MAIEFWAATLARGEAITFSSETKGKREEIPNYQFPMINSRLPLEYSQSACSRQKLDRSAQPHTC